MTFTIKYLKLHYSILSIILIYSISQFLVQMSLVRHKPYIKIHHHFYVHHKPENKIISNKLIIINIYKYLMIRIYQYFGFILQDQIIFMIKEKNLTMDQAYR